MNNQAPEKRNYKTDGSLYVHSIFDTIQGEGPFSGVPATFIRLAGCNLQCPGCDTEYTSERQLFAPWQLRRRITESPQHKRDGRLVVFTGGEPFRQNIGPTVYKLVNNGFRVQIETNGTLYFAGPWNHPAVSVVCSPKTPKLNEKILSFVRAFKYVVNAGNVAPDGLPYTALAVSEKHVLSTDPGTWVARPPKGFTGPIYIQPFDEQDEETNKANREAAIESCLLHGYTLCLQLHKIVGLP